MQTLLSTAKGNICSPIYRVKYISLVSFALYRDDFVQWIDANWYNEIFLNGFHCDFFIDI